MSRRRAQVTQEEIARVLRAIKQADVEAHVEIIPEKGTIRLIPRQPQERPDVDRKPRPIL